MRAIIIAALLGFLLATPMAGAQSTEARTPPTSEGVRMNREVILQELKENCLACCLGWRPQLRDQLRLNESRCQTICSEFASWFLRKVM